MIVVEHNQIELDYCTACRGVWFDYGELELLLGSMSLESTHELLDSILHSPEAASAEKKRKCPICNQKMKKATIGKEPGILIDACRREDGLWFDGGEVAHLIKQLAVTPVGKRDSNQQIISFLGDVFHAQD
jgi:Zn-finger nucleic acid-binding protein